MADILTIGANAASTYKTAMDVTSHNVANVGTEGYSRQRAEISSNTPSVIGQSFLGGGSTVDSVTRIQADYIQTQLNQSNSSVERYSQQLQLSEQLEGIISSNDEGVQEFMQRFFDSMQEVSDNPTSTASRQMLLDEAGNLESYIGNLTTVLDDTQEQVNSQIGSLVDEINDRLQTIQQINKAVELALSVGTQTPNDLLDQRDQAVLELSSYIDIKTYEQDDGRLDIFTSAGNVPLLADDYITQISAELGPYTDENRVEVYMNVGGTKRVMSDQISGGQLGGVLDFRDNMLDTAQDELGLMLNGLVASLNWQHYQGYDENGDAGGNLFTPLSVDAIQNKNNTGLEDGSNIVVSFNPNAGVSEPPYAPTGTEAQPATYGDKETYLENAFAAIAEFEAREYEIRFDGTTYQFYDHKTGENLTTSAVETPAGSGNYQLDGLEFDLSGALAMDAGDSFLVKPHQEMLEQFETALSDTDLIAARGQSPVDSDNDGSIDDEVPAPAASGDNVNMANMANLQSKKLLLSDDSGQASETLLGAYSLMSSNVGMYVRGSEIQLTAQSNVYDQVMAQRESLSGVSLDEEAANLVKYQQAYEAAAQVISAAQSMFQTLISVVRG